MKKHSCHQICPRCQSCQSASIIPLLRTTSQSCLSQSALRFHNTLLFPGSTLSLCLSVGSFLSALTPLPLHRYPLLRITSEPCLTVSSFLYVCLTLCHCCPCKVHSLMLCVNPAPVKLLPTFPFAIHFCEVSCHMFLLSAYWQTFIYVWSSHVTSLWNYSLSISFFVLCCFPLCNVLVDCLLQSSDSDVFGHITAVLSSAL